MEVPTSTEGSNTYVWNVEFHQLRLNFQEARDLCVKLMKWLIEHGEL